MKKLAVSTLLILFAYTSSFAQERLNTKMGLGFQLVQYQKDFGLGLNVTSPYFLHDRVAIRVKGNIMWNEHENSSNQITWTSYSMYH